MANSVKKTQMVVRILTVIREWSVMIIQPHSKELVAETVQSDYQEMEALAMVIIL